MPDAHDAQALLTERTRAIVLVSPGNPTGTTLPADLIYKFYHLACDAGITLVIDETYRAFRQQAGPPHYLFRQSGWPANLVCLYSFSKEFAIPGLRIGAAVGHESLIAELAKVTAAMSVCATTIGQEAAYVAVTSAKAWRDNQAAVLAKQRDVYVAFMRDRPGGFELLSAGSFFGWVKHPFIGMTAEDAARHLATEGLFTLPGTAFFPSGQGDNLLRFGIGNLMPSTIDDLVARLRKVGSIA